MSPGPDVEHGAVGELDPSPPGEHDEHLVGLRVGAHAGGVRPHAHLDPRRATTSADPVRGSPATDWAGATGSHVEGEGAARMTRGPESPANVGMAPMLARARAAPAPVMGAALRCQQPCWHEPGRTCGRMRAMTIDPSAAGGASFGGASVLDDLAWRGLIAHSTDLDALACRAGDRPDHALLRLRPHCPEPARGAPGPDADRTPVPAGRPPPPRPRRRGHRDDRRPQAHQRAHAQRGRGRGGVVGRDPPPARAVLRLRGPGCRPDGQQPRLDRAHVGHRVPPRHRQALQREPDARPRGGGPAPGRPGHLVHGVQLRPAAVHGLPRALPALRLPAADRGLGPVRQHRGRCRPRAPRRGCVGARPDHAPDDQGRRHEVRQDRGWGRMARSRS